MSKKLKCTLSWYYLVVSLKFWIKNLDLYIIDNIIRKIMREQMKKSEDPTASAYGQNRREDKKNRLGRKSVFLNFWTRWKESQVRSRILQKQRKFISNEKDFVPWGTSRKLEEQIIEVYNAYPYDMNLTVQDLKEMAICLYFKEHPYCNRYLEKVEGYTFETYSPKTDLVGMTLNCGRTSMAMVLSYLS